MLKEFKEFAMRGSIIDLAVGVIIGGAFQKIGSFRRGGRYDLPPELRGVLRSFLKRTGLRETTVLLSVFARPCFFISLPPPRRPGAPPGTDRRGPESAAREGNRGAFWRNGPEKNKKTPKNGPPVSFCCGKRGFLV